MAIVRTIVGFCPPLATASLMRDVTIASIGLGILLITGGIVLWIVRRATLGKVRGSEAAEAMDVLERVHKRGVMTDEEFSRARRIALGMPAEDARPAGQEPPGQVGQGEKQP